MFVAVREFAYLTAQTASRYRLLMRLFYEGQQTLEHAFPPEELLVRVGAREATEITLEGLVLDLEQLVAWGNLGRRRDTSRVDSLAQYARRRNLYYATARGLAIEGFLEAGLDAAAETVAVGSGIVGSLEAQWARIAILLDAQHLEELDTAWTSFQRDFAALSGDVRSLTLNLERKLSLEDLTDFLEFKDAVRSYVERLSNELAGPGRRLRDTLVAVPPERQAALLGQLASVRSGRLTRDAAVLNADQAARVVQREWAALLGWLTRPAGQGDGLEYGIQALRGAVSRVLAFVDAVHRTRELGTGRAAELSALAAQLGGLDDVFLAREELSQALSLSAPLHAPESFEREGVRHSWLEPVEPVTLRPVTRGRETERVSAAVRDTSQEARQAARNALHAHREHEAALLALFGETNSFELTTLEVGDDALVAELLNWLSAAFHASHEASPVVTVPGPAGRQVRIHLLDTPAVLATPSGTLWLEQGAKLELVHTGKGGQT